MVITKHQVWFESWTAAFADTFEPGSKFPGGGGGRFDFLLVILGTHVLTTSS